MAIVAGVLFVMLASSPCCPHCSGFVRDRIDRLGLATGTAPSRRGGALTLVPVGATRSSAAAAVALAAASVFLLVAAAPA
jgi:hypothetical protein